MKEAEKGDEDCETMEAEAARRDPGDGGDLEQEVERDSPAETLKEDQGPAESAEQTEEQDEAPHEAELENMRQSELFKEE